jgi:hypothetical protein
LSAGSYTVYAKFTPDNTSIYDPTECPAALVVAKATPSCTFGPLAAITYGTPLSTIQQSAVFSPASSSTSYTISDGALASPIANSTSILGEILAASTTAYTITASVRSTPNYNARSCSASLTVNPKSLTCYPVPAVMFRGTNPASIPLTHTCEGFVNGDTMVKVVGGGLTTNADATSAPGFYTIRYVVDNPPTIPNYTVTTSSALLEVKALLTSRCSVSLSGSSFTYGTPITPVGTGTTDSGAALAGQFTYSYSGSGVSNANISGPITPNANAGGTSYTVTATFDPTDPTFADATCPATTFTVTKAQPTCEWAAPGAISYGSLLSSTQLNATATFNGVRVDGLFSYSQPESTALPAGTTEISATFTPTDSTNYLSCLVKRNQVIRKAPLACRADDRRIIDGEALPAASSLTFSCSGFIAPDTQSTASITTGGLKINGSAITHGLVPPNSPTSPNYDITWTDGVLITDPKKPSMCTVSAGTGVFTYPNSQNPITPTTVGKIATGTSKGSTLLGATTYRIAPTSTGIESALTTTTNYNAGSYTLYADFVPNDPTYASSRCSTPITINKGKYLCSLTSSSPINYGTSLSLAASATVAGGASYSSGDAGQVGLFTFTPAVGSILTPTTYKPQVVFSPPSAVANNFDGCSATTTAVVNKAPVTCRPNNKTKVYGAANPPLDYTCRLGTASTGAVITSNISGGFLNASVDETTPPKATLPYAYEGAITWSTQYPWSEVYEIAVGANASGEESGTIEITKAPLTCKADDKTIAVGSALPSAADYTYKCSGFVRTADTPTNSLSNITLKAYYNSGDSAITQEDLESAGGPYPIRQTTGQMITSTKYTVTMNVGRLFVVSQTPTSCSLSVTGNPFTYGNAITIGTSGTTIRATGPASIDGIFSSYFVSSNGAANVVYNPSSLLNVGTHVFTAIFSPTNTTWYGTSECSIPITINPRPYVCTWNLSPARVIAYGTPLSSTHLNATAAPSPSLTGAPTGVFAYTPPINTVLLPSSNNYILKTVFDPQSTNFTGCSASVPITVNKIPVTCTANEATREYGVANPPFSFTCRRDDNTIVTDGIKGGALTTEATAASAVNDSTGYDITWASVPTSSLYTITPANGKLKVTKAPLSCTADSHTKIQGQSDPSLTYQCSELRNTDTKPAATLSRVTGETPGNYDINFTSCPTASNYTVTCNKGNLEILPNGSCSISIISGSTKTYGENTQATVTSSAGLAGSVTFSRTQTGGTATAIGSAVSLAAGGSATSTAVLLDANSYTVSALFTPTNTSIPASTCSTSLQVNKAPTTCRWTLNPAAISVGDSVTSSMLNGIAASSATTFSSGLAYSKPDGSALSAGNTFTTAGSYPLKMTFTPTSTNYLGCEASQTLTVNKLSTTCSVPASTAITWPAPVTIGTSSDTLPLVHTDSGRNFSYQYRLRGGSSWSLLGNNSSLPPGTYDLGATLAENSTYSAALCYAGTLAVSRATALCSISDYSLKYGAAVTINDSGGMYKASQVETAGAFFSSRAFNYKYRVANSTGSGITLLDGTKPDVSRYDVFAKLPGNDYYLETTCSGLLTVTTNTLPTAPTPTPVPHAGGCGDGVVDRESGETCDPGNSASCEGCACDPVTCTLDCGVQCLTLFASTCNADGSTLNLKWGQNVMMRFNGVDFDCSSHPNCCPPAGPTQGLGASRSDRQCYDQNGNLRSGASDNRTDRFQLGTTCLHGGVQVEDPTSSALVFERSTETGKIIMPPTYVTSCSCSVGSATPSPRYACVDAHWGIATWTYP